MFDMINLKLDRRSIISIMIQPLHGALVVFVM